MKDFNLPGLFRSAVWEARNQQKPHVHIVIPEVEKDEFIEALTNTPFVQTHSPIKRATVPMTFHIDDVTVFLHASEHLEVDVIVTTFERP